MIAMMALYLILDTTLLSAMLRVLASHKLKTNTVQQLAIHGTSADDTPLDEPYIQLKEVRAKGITVVNIVFTKVRKTKAAIGLLYIASGQMLLFRTWSPSSL